MSEVKYIDLDAGLARVRGNTLIYKKMLNLFLTSGEFAALEEALSQGDWARGADIAHTIKGMTGNLSLDAVYTESTELMNQMRQGDPPDSDTLARYRSAVAETKSQAEKMAAEL